jgi:hypothetical protein
MNNRIYALTQNNDELTATAINSASGTNVLYVSTGDGPSNLVTLTLSNNTTSQVTIPAGTNGVVAQPPPTTAGGQLYIGFDSVLITYITLSEVTVSIDGWTIDYSYISDGYIGLSPQADVVLNANGGSVSFQMKGIEPTTILTSGYISVTYFNLETIARNMVMASVIVSMPPPPENIPLVLDVSFSGNDMVYITPPSATAIENTLVLSISNPSGSPLVPGGYSSWDPTNPPTFAITFVYGTLQGQLTSDGSGIQVNPTQNYDNEWPQPSREGQGVSPWWKLELDQGTTGYVLDANTTVLYTISLISTQAAPGVTVCILSWTGIPGYLDGQSVIDILKVNPTTASVSFNLPNNTIDLTNPTIAATAALTVNATNVSMVVLTNSDEDLNAQISQNAISNYTFSISPNITTTYMLIATNLDTAQLITDSVTVEVIPDFYTMFAKGTIVMWSGDPTALPYGWTLCNGVAMPDGTPTPNLQDKFIVGIGPTLSPSGQSTSGGSFTHTHSFSFQPGDLMNTASAAIDGSHGHKSVFQTTMMVSSGHTSHYMVMYGNSNNTSYSSSTPESNYSVDTDTQNNAGAHRHMVPSSAKTFTTGTNSDIVPWYSLAFIIKIF